MEKKKRFGKHLLSFLALLLLAVSVILTGCGGSDESALSTSISSAESASSAAAEEETEESRAEEEDTEPEELSEEEAGESDGTEEESGEAAADEAEAEESPAETAVQQYYFRNEKLLNSHYEKHGIEMGFASPEEYEAAASAVITNPDALHKQESEDNDEVYYVEETNEFAVLSDDGYIRTYFYPSAGIDYYNRQ